jgi:Domain of unknown function (DUF5680)
MRLRLSLPEKTCRGLREGDTAWVGSASTVLVGRRGYAAGRSAVKTREADPSTTIVLEQGDWKFHDNYFGGEPYDGREVVFLRGQPVWMAIYYGQVQDANVDSVYSFLQRAFRDAPADFPVRGPEELTEGPFSYQNVHDGDVASFSGPRDDSGGRAIGVRRPLCGRVRRPTERRLRVVGNEPYVSLHFLGADHYAK